MTSHGDDDDDVLMSASAPSAAVARIQTLGPEQNARGNYLHFLVFGVKSLEDRAVNKASRSFTVSSEGPTWVISLLKAPTSSA